MLIQLAVGILASTICIAIHAMVMTAIVRVAPGIAGALIGEADVLYFAFVNYTTLGYGDVLPATGWRLLGPATAMCGILLFGWSIAVIFEVLRKTLGHERTHSTEDC